MIAVGGNGAANKFAVEVAGAFPGTVRAAVGFDRECAGDRAAPAALAEMLGKSQGVPPVAVGEIGLDFHYHPETAGGQCDLFREQLRVARAHSLPVIVHSREAEHATLELLREHSASLPPGACGPGVLHCFTGSEAFARELVELGFCLGFGGIVTFRNAGNLRNIAASVPDEVLLLETDSPFLAPAAHRGERNEPAYLPDIARTICEARGCTEEELADLTTANAEKLFGR